MTQEELNALWATHDGGRGISDHDLALLIESARVGLQYLTARGPAYKLARNDTQQTLTQLLYFADARRKEPVKL